MTEEKMREALTAQCLRELHASEIEREIAIQLYIHEMDAPDLVSREQAIGCYDHPDSTGPHCGDCTNVACTCLRCVRDEADAKAKGIAAGLRALLSQEGLVAGADGWRDMASAPKDGTHILLVDDAPDREVVIGYWDENTDWRHVPGEWPVVPVAWQPLPAPPVAGADGKGGKP